MSEITLKAKKREGNTGETLNQLRKKGIIPGIYYGHDVGNINIAATEIDLRPIIYTTESNIVNLKFDEDKPLSCILKDVQFHPVTDKPLHFDLFALKEGETIDIEASDEPIAAIAESEERHGEVMSDSAFDQANGGTSR